MGWGRTQECGDCEDKLTIDCVGNLGMHEEKGSLAADSVGLLWLAPLHTVRGRYKAVIEKLRGPEAKVLWTILSSDAYQR